MPDTTHAIERTSPKVPGSTFIGRCWQCGLEDLPASAALEACPNTLGMARDDSLLRAINGPDNEESTEWK